jgi:hypothetical protein
MPKYRMIVYTEELYAEVVVEAADKDAARARVDAMTGGELVTLDWQISDDALQPWNVVRNFESGDTVEPFEGERKADIAAAEEGA